RRGGRRCGVEAEAAARRIDATTEREAAREHESCRPHGIGSDERDDGSRDTTARTLTCDAGTMAEGPAHDDATRRILESARPRRAVEAQRALAGFRSRVFGALPRAVTLARYVLLDRIGEGGAGTVWSAFDPELDRRVAIKLVIGDAIDDEAETRLMREAR